MDRAAKELLHIRGWLQRVDEVVARGKDAYLTDDLLQEAGDSLTPQDVTAKGLRPFLAVIRQQMLCLEAVFGHI